MSEHGTKTEINWEMRLRRDRDICSNHDIMEDYDGLGKIPAKLIHIRLELDISMLEVVCSYLTAFHWHSRF